MKSLFLQCGEHLKPDSLTVTFTNCHKFNELVQGWANFLGRGPHSEIHALQRAILKKILEKIYS